MRTPAQNPWRVAYQNIERSTGLATTWPTRIGAKQIQFFRDCYQLITETVRNWTLLLFGALWPDYKVGNIQLGIDSPRPASDGRELLNSRLISVKTVKLYGLDETADVTLSVMSFGQFITHDITLSEDFTFGIDL